MALATCITVLIRCVHYGQPENPAKEVKVAIMSFSHELPFQTNLFVMTEGRIVCMIVRDSVLFRTYCIAMGKTEMFKHYPAQHKLSVAEEAEVSTASLVLPIVIII